MRAFRISPGVGEQICPVNAFTNRAFREDEPREARFDADRCVRYFSEMEENGDPSVCSLCLYVCPYGNGHV
jgi:epoxyqueuosine reductase